MATPEIRAVGLTPESGPSDAKDLLVVGAGLGTGVHALWAECARHLADLFDVVGWDMPGHGASPPHDGPLSVAGLAGAVAALVRDRRAAGAVGEGVRVAYAGVSLGGAVGMQLALDHGDLFDGIAVICSAAQIGDPTMWRDRAEFVAASGTPSQVVGSAERWFAPGFIERQPGRATGLLHTLQDADRHSYAGLCEALASYDVRDRIGEITTPMVTIHGAVDAVCPPARGEEIVGGVADGRAFVLDGVAHQAPVEAPREVAEILAAHLVR